MATGNIGRLSDVILDEIGLEGLEGLTIEGLWIRLSSVLKIPLPFHDNFQTQIWNFILKHPTNILFYELPKPRAQLKTFVRHEMVDAESGLPYSPKECPFTIYNFNPIEKDGIKGSCEDYDTRVQIPNEQAKNLTVNEIVQQWGDKFVIVGSQMLRDKALFPSTISTHIELSIVHYCFLERIARSRFNGEVTIGRHSLMTFGGNDSKVLFYIRSKLCAHKLIVKQPYSEKRQSGCSLNGFLLTLPRFFLEFKTKTMWYLETIIQYIKSKPNKIADYAEIRNLFGDNFEKSFKRLCNSQLYRKYMDFGLKVPYRTIYPDASPAEWKFKSRNSEKVVRAVALKDENIDFDEIWHNEEHGNDEKELNEITFYDNANTYTDMPSWKQAAQIIATFGAEGISQAELGNILGYKRFLMRHLIRYVCDTGLVTYYLTDEGRQRMKKYILKKYLPKVGESTSCQAIADLEDIEHVKKEIELQVIKSEDDEIEDGEKDPEKTQTSTSSALPELQPLDIELTVSPTVFDHYRQHKRALLEKDLTKRQRERINIITNLLNSERIVNSRKLVTIISANEKKHGYKDKICKKSLNRLLFWMHTQKRIHGYEIKILSKGHSKHLTFICHISVNENDPKLVEQTEKLKASFPYLIAERIRRAENLLNNSKQSAFAQEKKCNLETDNTEVTSRRNAPKFIRMKIIHELLYHIVYGIQQNTETFTYDDLIASLEGQKFALHVDDLKSEPYPIYSLHLDWKMFIGPLPKYEKHGIGWVYVHDVIQRMPLSVFCSFHNIKNNSSPLLDEYMRHPVKKHFLLSYLPTDLRIFLVKDRLLYQPIDETLRRMCFGGMIQLGERSLKDQCFVYVNRNLKLLDTRTSAKAYDQISDDRDYKPIYFCLNSGHDIIKYWQELQHICMSTFLGFRLCKTAPKTSTRKLDLVSNMLPTVTPEEAIMNDVGYLPGDNKGAAGLDTAFYAYVLRNWTWSSRKVSLQNKKFMQRCPVRYSKLLRRKDPVSTTQLKRVVLNKSDRVRFKRRSSIEGKYKGSSKNVYDAIDKDALKRMTKLRVSWTDEEDRLLLLCRVASNYLNLTNNNTVTSHTYRDILHWHLNSLNKTSRACQRRILYMCKKKTFKDRLEIWSQEAMQSQYINSLFGPKFLEQLKIVYENSNDYMSALRIHFVTLVYYLEKIIGKSESEVEKLIILPETVTEFCKLYKERVYYHFPTPIKHYDPSTIEEVNLSTLNAFIHCSVCCTKDKTLYNIQSFEVFKNYPEDVLQKAVQKVRADRLVVAKKNRLSASCQPLALEGKIYHIANNYCQLFYLQLPYRVIEQCYEAFQLFISKLFDNTNSDPRGTTNKTCMEYTSVTAGTALFIAELSQSNNFIFEVHTPKQVLKVDPSADNDARCSEKILERFRELFCMAPKQDYSNYFEAESNETVTKGIKFNFNIDTIKIRTNPYDFVNKIADSNVHFFCILNNINSSINLNITLVNQDKLCPFDNCVMKQEDYLTSIDTLIRNNAEIVQKLNTYPNNDNSMELPKGEIIINSENVNKIYHYLNRIIKDATKQQDVKDFGKIVLNRNIIDFNSLSKELLEFDKDQDEQEDDDVTEQTYSTESNDRVNRFQDSLVVNTSKLLISCATSYDTSDTLVFKNANVPPYIHQFSIQRDEILKKIVQDALWEETNTSEDELRAILSEENLSEDEVQFIFDVLNFIKTFELGVPAAELRNKFGDEQLLMKSTGILRKYFFIKRVGVYSYIYVYKTFINPWIVNTYHIKRLEREAISARSIPTNLDFSKHREDVNICSNPKRPRLEKDLEQTSLEMDVNFLDASSKEGELSQETNSMERPRRCPKPVQRFSELESEQCRAKPIVNREPIIMRPCPWIRVNGSLNRRVLDKWIGTIFNECISHAGQTLYNLCCRFYHLHPVNIRFLLEILTDLGCMKLKVYKTSSVVGLFTEYEPPQIEDATDFSDIKDTFVHVEPNAMTNIAYFIGDKKYQFDFV